jgi:hypothetical protein
MSTPTLGLFLAQAGALLTAMLLARSYALRHTPQCYLPARIRARELRRDGFCRRATVPAAIATLVGLALIVIS